MPDPLSPESVLSLLESSLDERLCAQIADGEHSGAAWSFVHGRPDPVASVDLLCGCLHAHAIRRELALPHRPELLFAAHAAASYILRAQRPSGRIDLLLCNPDSGPDTAFATGRLCRAIESLSRRKLAPAEAAIDAAIRQFIGRAVPGIIARGFHTPNHRWVVAAALAHATHVLGDLGAESMINAYLAEGPDADDEGAWIERSSGVYDAVCDISMLVLAAVRSFAPALPAVRANLERNLVMLNHDGAIETCLSTRQDRNEAPTPTELAAAYAWAAVACKEPAFAAAARHLLGRPHNQASPGLSTVAYTVLKHGAPPPGAPLAERAERFFPRGRLWRIRRGELGMSVCGDGQPLVHLRHGRGDLFVGLHVAYGGPAGQFVAQRMAMAGDVATLECERPLCDLLPLGRTVPPAQWDEVIPQRDSVRRETAPVTVRLRELPPEGSWCGGLEMHVSLSHPLSGVPAQVTLDFSPGGQWQAPGCVTEPSAGQTIFLTGGTGAMRYGTRWIAVTGGCDAHRMWTVRGCHAAPDRVRVIVPLLTPIDHVLRLRGFVGPVLPDVS
jgi:hypothetical protein